MKITAHEHSELLEHFRRNALWTRSEEDPTLWLYTDGRGTDQYAVRFARISVDPELFDASLHPIAELKVDETLRALLLRRSSYATRVRVEEFLRDELKADPETAELSALFIASLEYPVPDRIVGTYLLQGGGYLRIERVDETFRLEASLPSRDRHMSFGEALSGILRARSNNVQAITEALTGERSE